MQVVVDCYSKDWVHYAFNQSFLTNQKETIAHFIGIESSWAYQEYQGSREAGCRKALSLVWQIIRAAWAGRTRNVVFLTMTSREISPVLMLRLLGFRVDYVMHKLNLRCRILRLHWKMIFGILDRLNVKALCFDVPHPLFTKYRLIDFNPYTLTNARPIDARKTPFGRIAFIGRPEDGKEYEAAEAIGEELGMEVIIFTDDALPGRYKTRPHTSCIEDCDVIWGYYDPEHYQGIQSGLPYVALQSGIRIVTNKNIGFVKFANLFPDYCVSCESLEEVKRMILNIHAISVLTR